MIISRVPRLKQVRPALWLGSISCCVLLSSCASLLPAVPPQGLARDYVLEPDLSWVARGKLGYQDEQQQSAAQFEWLHNGLDDYQIRVYSALGGNAIFTKQPSGSRLRIGREEIVNPRNLAALLQQELALSIPLEQLEYWLRGLAYPSSPAKVRLNEQGLPLSIAQDGWELNYSNFIAGLAHNIRATNQEYQISIRLIISSWERQNNQT